MDLSNKVAIVTGSGQGLGLACAQALAQPGASVVVNDINEETAAAAAAFISERDGKAHNVVGAVDTETAQALVDSAVETVVRLDIPGAR